MRNFIENFSYIKFDRSNLKNNRDLEVFIPNSAFSDVMLMKLTGLKSCTGKSDDVKFDRSNLKDNAAMCILTIYYVFYIEISMKLRGMWNN